MDETMAGKYPKPTIINLSSKYPVWLHEVEKIIKETGDEDQYQQAAPGVPWNLMKQRLRCLKYVCLFDDLSHKKVISYSNCYSDEDEIIFKLKKMFDKMKPEPELVSERQNDETGFQDKPCYDYTKKVIVDPYGIYTASLHNVLKAISKDYNPGDPIYDWAEKLADDPELDGPAILLCPEKIETIYNTLSCRSNFNLPLEPSPYYTFLKFVYLHELGHHVYPSVRRNLYAWEAFANFFAFGFLSPTDRLTLFHKASTQPFEYSIYNGLLMMLYPHMLPELAGIKRANLLLATEAELFMEQLELSMFERGLPLKQDYIDLLMRLCERVFEENLKVSPCLEHFLYLIADLYRSTDLFNLDFLIDLQDMNNVMFDTRENNLSWHKKVIRCSRVVI